MKISSSIRQLHQSQYEINKPLEIRVKDLLGDGNKSRWFYKARVKELESFAQKIETGRFKPAALEDFFACTIVVENRKAISEAKELVEKFCTIEYRRPEDDITTHKYPEIFQFDDLRLYVKLKPLDIGPSTPIDNVIFEVQIKTFLQYAWGIATHNLIYKGDSISWGKARLAFQIKAMLEHAEISIEQVNEIAKSSALSITDAKTQTFKDIISWLESTWDKELLPKDLFRLSQTIEKLMSSLKLELKDIKDAVDSDTRVGLGTNLKNLSPYEVVTKSLLNQRRHEFITYQKNKWGKLKILITPEMDVAEDLKTFQNDNLLIVK